MSQPWCSWWAMCAMTPYVVMYRVEGGQLPPDREEQIGRPGEARETRGGQEEQGRPGEVRETRRSQRGQGEHQGRPSSSARPQPSGLTGTADCIKEARSTANCMKHALKTSCCFSAQTHTHTPLTGLTRKRLSEHKRCIDSSEVTLSDTRCEQSCLLSGPAWWGCGQ